MKVPTVDEMQAMFRAHTEAAVQVIVEIMTTGSGAKGEAVRLAAAKEILNRGWGRPAGTKGPHKDKDAATDEAAPRPEWRSKDGKTYAQLYAEKEAENAAAAAVQPPAVTSPASTPPPTPPPTATPGNAAAASSPSR